MNDVLRAPGSALRFLAAPVTALCLATSVLAGPGEDNEDANVARKVHKARSTAHQAKAEREALRDFQEDVSSYAELHDKELRKLASGADADAESQRHDLTLAIAKRRASARPGDIFAPEVQPLFRRMIAEQLQGPDTLAARKAVLEGNPVEKEEDAVEVVVRVNGEYPSGAPRSTVPVSVLLTLPPLPESLRYRFVGRDLILVDTTAQLIVDFLPAAAPELTQK